ncbi:MAG: TonB family protein [Thermoanaerobaculales bacterium]
MDPVTEVLLARERARPRLLPWVVLAVSMHAGAAAAAFFVGRYSTSRPVQLPAVSVRLVRPAPVKRRPPRQAAARSSPVPQPTAPQATAVPEPSAVPTAPPVEKIPVAASADAMPAAESSATPAPTPPPAPTGGGHGLSLGQSSAGETPGIPADFRFTFYIERMLALIESRWYKPAAPAGASARVRFRILRDGRVEAIQLEASSGISSFDRAALRALYGANPLPPLPPAYGKTSLTVHLNFAE